MKLVPAFGLDGSPAAVIIGDCRKVYINPTQWLGLGYGERKFILAHEQAHCLHGIESESDADSYALDQIREMGIGLHHAKNAIKKTLDLSNPSHKKRADKIQQQISSMAATPIDNQFTGPRYSSASDAPYSQPSQSNGSGFDWNQLTDTFLQVGGDVVGDLLSSNNLPSGSTYPANQAPATNSGFPWIYVAAAAALVLVGWLLIKK